MSKSIWRAQLYQELAAITVQGDILDIGGDRRSGYHVLLKGEHNIEVNNFGVEGADHNFDLEEPFPVEDSSYDVVLCINVLEHIYDYRNVLSECHRILKPGGQLIVAVPFLIRVHPSPRDYWRYTADTLEKISYEAGFSTVTITAVGTGPFAAAYSHLHNVFRFSFIQIPLQYVAILLDRILATLAPGSSFTKQSYPLGYLLKTEKSD